ncbi:MAG: hypothetical protein COX30_04910 [Candidatus Moranbacteria bacterium CG23_combo_of_CG06-09_8_20_14_all_39_10]|nr:MAG: hypothetical protein COX30_04910 [Candidatus Moranbacteria bacterium CG23_combo_of_CG06-09_8_20_14_all_39_10]
MNSREIFQPRPVGDKSQEPSYTLELINKFGGYNNLKAHIDRKMAAAKMQKIEIGSSSPTGGFDFTNFVLGEEISCMSKEKIEGLNQIINGMANEIDDVRSGLAAREPKKIKSEAEIKAEREKSKEVSFAEGFQKKREGEAKMLGIDEEDI